MDTRITLKSFLLFLTLLLGGYANATATPELRNAHYHQGNTLPWYAEFAQPTLGTDNFWQWFKSQYPSYQKFDFIIESDKTDEVGLRHVRYVQMLNQIPVNHSAIILHLQHNIVESFNTDLFAFTPGDYSTSLATNKTLTIATKHYFNGPESNWNPTPESKTPELIWAKSTTGYEQSPFYLCHAYRIKVSEGEIHDKIYINTQTGAIVLKENLIAHIDTVNKAKTLYRGLRTIKADFVKKDSFRLRENGQRYIETFLQFQGTDFWNKTNRWSDSSYGTNDIHWGTEVLMDLLKKRFNVNSFDNKGTLLYSLSQPSSSGNAYWTLGGNYVNYYTGTSGSVTPCTSLDVVGHELGHGVLDGIAKLVYSGESGALHESFGDIQGYITERTGDSTSYDWIVGDQVWVGGIRDMANPKNFQNPDTYNGKYFGGGFHSDAGVQNHFFYTLTHGDTGTNDNSYNYSVKGLGFEKGVKIVYQAILNYITPNTDFGMVATFDVKAAKDLYGSCGIEAAMTKEAWLVAGVSDTSTIINFDHIVSNQKLYCGTNNTNVPFYSLGDVSRKCTWYFGPNDSLVNHNVVKNFSKSGTYTIYLKTEVCKKTFFDTTTVSLSLNPIANLNSMAAKYCQSNDSLSIVNTSVHTEPTLPISYSWIVGPFNNYNTSGKNIKVARNATADYYIELKASYSNGCKDTAALAYVVVGNVKPSFTAKNACPCADLKLKNTTDISASTYSFKWQFDDTTSKTLFQPTKNYCREGSHSIVLKSTDLITGCSDTAIRYVTVYNKPKPVIGMSSYCYGDSGQLVDLTTHNRSIAYNEWTLGFWNPQNMDTIKFKVVDSTQQTFKLTVYDDLGCQNTTSISVKPEILNVNFNAQNFCSHQSTQFDASINYRKPLIDYYWTVNNTKKYINQLHPTEKFSTQTLTVSFRANTKDCKAIQTKTFEIFETPKADYTVQDQVCSGDSFYFKNQSNYTLPVTHEWNLASTGLYKTKDVTKAWQVNRATSYDVCLKETNTKGCADSICKQVTVNENPNCDFSAENYWINYDGRGYKFIVAQNNHTNYQWDFGDGTTGSTNNMVHQYFNDGNYTVKVKVTSSTGCLCELTKTFKVAKSNINKLAVQSFKIYPIPSSDILNIVGEANQEYEWQMLSMDGKSISTGSFNHSTAINLNGLAKGFYMLRLYDGSAWTTTKIEVL